MENDQIAVRRFLRVEENERTVYDRTYRTFLRLAGYRTFQALLDSESIEVIRMTNYDPTDRIDPEEIPTLWERTTTGFERNEPVLVGAMALTRVRALGSVPVVFHLFDDGNDVTIRIVLNRKDRGSLEAILDLLDDLEASAHPLKGRLLQVSPGLVGFLPRQKVERDDIFLPPSILDELEQAFLFLIEPDAVPRQLHHRAVLIAGPPGMGKTLLCKWISGIVKATVLWVTPGALWRAGASALLDLARKLGPTLLILEDLDVASGTRDGNSPLGDLLAELDGFTSLDGIGILATTNHPEQLDHALDPRSRPGRFQRFLTVETLDPELRRGLIRHLLDTSEVLPPAGPEIVTRIHRASERFTGDQTTVLVRDVELHWLHATGRGETPDLDTVVRRALEERPAVLRSSGFAPA